MNKENWKDIEGYKGLYQVSNLGRIKSVERKVKNAKGYRIVKSKILTDRIDKGGYKIIDLRNGKEKKTYKVHRLVALAFIPNPDNKPEVNHKQEDKKDLNCVSNLEWATSKENMNYGTINQRKAKRFSKKVYQYTLDNRLIKIWNSTKECKQEGFNSSHVADCCRGISKTHKGYRWSYEPIENKEE
ncbi:NUMOD4 domain-containing protein [Clostridium botulinum]|uniref:NUMOD4 domain-containing protein n=1 Tax=Clostridium botulinum B2 450 TaxID=1379739 RepID=A0A0D1BQB1_CLOBO|nr:NUMOD4 domain-containing protein [Clostridium botulinum]KIS22027.1 hypothetical protein N495_16180 [Clostridium botulinum B2 450]